MNIHMKKRFSVGIDVFMKKNNQPKTRHIKINDERTQLKYVYVYNGKGRPGNRFDR